MSYINSCATNERASRAWPLLNKYMYPLKRSCAHISSSQSVAPTPPHPLHYALVRQIKSMALVISWVIGTMVIPSSRTTYSLLRITFVTVLQARESGSQIDIDNPVIVKIVSHSKDLLWHSAQVEKRGELVWQKAAIVFTQVLYGHMEIGSTWHVNVPKSVGKEATTASSLLLGCSSPSCSSCSVMMWLALTKDEDGSPRRWFVGLWALIVPLSMAFSFLFGIGMDEMM